ncbi:MAG: hypothetical protein U0610_16275 [bacterium]
MRFRIVVGAWLGAIALAVAARAADATGAGPAAAGTGDSKPAAGTDGTSNLPGGLALLPILQDISLHGAFDFAYERRDYTDNPLDGHDVLKNYHHFLFVDRHAKDDPFFLTAEVVDLTFYEIGVREELGFAPAVATLKAGKILVPFGPDPLFHHAYGGLTGFDQEILPTVWAELGGTLGLVSQLGDLTIANDLYGVQGYAVDATDAVVDLTSDLSSSDAVRFGVGNRVRVGWGPVSGWYSIYVNNMGFGQRLVMQAVDVTLWRPDWPVLENLAVAVGAMRADVIEKSSAHNYYHFGDYVQVRYYATDWLYLQYRGGFRSYDNRDGFYFDDERKDANDTSAHSVSIVALHRGATVGLSHYWRLEEADEQANDFLRLELRYDF